MTLKNKVKRGANSSRAGSVPMTLEKAVDRTELDVFSQDGPESRPTLKPAVPQEIIDGIQPIQVVTERKEREQREQEIQAKKQEYSKKMLYYGGCAVGVVVCYFAYSYYFGGAKPKIDPVV